MTPRSGRSSPATQPAPRARRRTLTREQVLTTALAIVDAEGLTALTMRRLAAELGVEAMSLYTHVRDKQDLINGMNIVVLSQLNRPTEVTDWPDVLTVFARRLYAAYLPRPELARALERTVPSHPQAFGAMERVLAALAQSGLAPSDQVSAFRGVIAVCLGFVIVHAGEPTAPRPTDDRPWAGWDESTMAASALPHIVELAPAFETTTNDDDFDFVIGACIDALRAKSEAQRPRRRRVTAPR